jgi:hypothetical protein
VTALTGAATADSPSNGTEQAQFTPAGELVRPDTYRNWIFLSSGYSMTYSPRAMDHKMFTNVFVPAWAYQAFLKSGAWPEHTTFVVEDRWSESKGSIVKDGQFQGEVMGLGVEVKDSARFPDHWAYFAFDRSASTTAMEPRNTCWQCHEDHAAVEHSFVQFYPTLQPVAKKFGVYRER